MQFDNDLAYRNAGIEFDDCCLAPARPIGETILPKACREAVDIVSAATDQHIIAAAADQYVVPRAAAKFVIAGIAYKLTGDIGSDDQIVARCSKKLASFGDAIKRDASGIRDSPRD